MGNQGIHALDCLGRLRKAGTTRRCATRADSSIAAPDSASYVPCSIAVRCPKHGAGYRFIADCRDSEAAREGMQDICGNLLKMQDSEKVSISLYQLSAR